MAFDQTTRNRLQKFVSEAKGLLSDEFTRQLQNDYGMAPDTGTISDIDNLTHLNDTQHQTAKLLRETMGHYQASSPDTDVKEILFRIVREQAFTVLNRLCALRMAEARGILIESISKGYNSKGFQLYARVAKTSLGESGETYRNYLFSLFDEFAIDLAVLFDRYSPMGRLFPKESVLLKLLDQINNMELETLWAEDETIGWIYQYFNSKDERKKMRDESSAPRNSRELAVRNQFFTPRYVVEFLTDNTLGRIWYEMTQGNTTLKDQCRYLVRRPNEIFLAKDEKAPEQNDHDADLSQEELLKQPAYIEHRLIKDPREILMLDPACGSMHFGLYAFDLFEKIYEEAWDLQATGQWQGAENENFGLLTETYTTREELLKDVPWLIIENNIHGIDIDPRAVQIAGLSLWLRAQRAWKELGIKTISRPQIKKSNIVCAEPMPGEKEFLKSFSERMKPRVLGQLVEIIFEKMELAGEAGSLLKIEEEIEEAIENAREEFNKELLRRKEEAGYLPGMPPKVGQRELFYFADLPDKTQFWNTAEEKILKALRIYAEQAEIEEGGGLRLFAEDAAKGFAFIDICRHKFDVALTNPPFGDASTNSKKYIANAYPISKVDILASFIEMINNRLHSCGRFGAITNRTALFLKTFANWRKKNFIEYGKMTHMADLGLGVLDDAMVEASAYIVQKKENNFTNHSIIAIRATNIVNSKEKHLLERIIKLKDMESPSDLFLLNFKNLESVPNYTFCYWLSNKVLTLFSLFHRLEDDGRCVERGLFTSDDFRYIRLFWEVPPKNIQFRGDWSYLSKGGEYAPYYSDVHLLVNSKNDFEEIKSTVVAKYKYLKGNTDWVLHPECQYGRSGATYPLRTTSDFAPRVLPEGCFWTNKGISIFGEKDSSENNLAIIGITNSAPFRLLVHSLVGAAEGAAKSYEEGLVANIPFPQLNDQNKKMISKGSLDIINNIQQINRTIETSPIFYSCSNISFTEDIINNSLYKINFIDQIVADGYGLDSNDLLGALKFLEHLGFSSLNAIQTKLRSIAAIDNTRNIISYCLGAIMGRWDTTREFNDKKSIELMKPFKQLPSCQPGMLQNTSSLPARSDDVPADYPLRISWSGIIVDDEGHSEDIITRIRETIEVIWKKNANSIEQETCEILGVRDLREYFAKSTKFFSDHLKRYSKSRHQAPIYWQLSTPSGSYTLWLYYHRLTDQTLYTCVNNFVAPKLKHVSDNAEGLRKKSNRTRQEEKDLEELSDLAMELKDFQEELLRIANFWKPNLNDGVQVTAAPLWKLFQLKAWQSKLKQTWKDLEKGKYDWAHLAYSIWPDRVIRASHKNHSYAIAHGLEDDLWEEIENGTDRQGNPKTRWVPRKLSEKELKLIIHEKMNE